MPHVSPQKVNNKMLQKLHQLFFAALTSKYTSRKNQQRFFDELLTTTEKTMLAKRLTAIALLARGLTPYQVSKTLKLSETTTNKLQVRLQAGKFDCVVKTHAGSRKGTLAHYVENLISPLPSYGKSFLKHLEDTY